MWNDIDLVPARTKDRTGSRQALGELGLLVLVALVAAVLPLVG